MTPHTHYFPSSLPPRQACPEYFDESRVKVPYTAKGALKRILAAVAAAKAAAAEEEEVVVVEEEEEEEEG